MKESSCPLGQSSSAVCCRPHTLPVIAADTSPGLEAVRMP